MFHLTIDVQCKVDASHVLYFADEEVDNAFLEDRQQELNEYLAYIPTLYHEAIKAGTLVANEELFVSYMKWCEDVLANYEDIRTASFEKRDEIVSKFSETGASVFEQTLHDGEVLRVERENGNVSVLLDMSGGFTPKAVIVLTFLQATETGGLGGSYIYDELIENEDGYGLRVLTGYPYEEWTIFFKDVTANYLYRPAAYAERDQYDSWATFYAALNQELRYFIVENFEFVEVILAEMTQRDNGIYVQEILLGETAEQAMESLYCDTHVNPYAHFSEMVPVEELEQAALSDDLTLRVRAFNTMFELGEPIAPIVNRVLRVIEVEEHEEMLMEITANHFDKFGRLDEDVKHRWGK